MPDILYTVAVDKDGNLIKANDAEKGNNFFCPVCSSELILRKSGKTGKGTKRPHFAHRSLTPNCTPETALHYAFKNLLSKEIQQHINSQTPLMISWPCNYCGDEHSENLLKNITAVKVEYNLTVCQPDIALFEKDGKPFAVIEVVVTHKPEESVINFYNDNEIILIQVNLTSDQDIDNLKEKIAKPNIVDTCFNPKCNRCGNFQQMKRMMIIDAHCWKCESEMKVSAIINGNFGPGTFTSDELEFAKSKGVILKSQYSRTVEDEYIANTCPKCGSFIGDHYLFTDYIAPASYGDIPSETFDIGYHCEHCDELAYENSEEDDEEFH